MLDFAVPVQFFFASCKSDHGEDVLILRDELVVPLMEASSYITGKQKEIDDRGQIISGVPCEINFTKAHELCAHVEKRLRGYPKITRYEISQSALKEMHEILNTLKQDIESLPDSLEQKQFRKEWNQLAQYISSLMAKKDMS
ncbi:hypothetical protein [Cardinium endosymbiont of Oedothorax gibbosus]|uniref:hypothetical protein n=1 Tax=Cardinium endosymbiont of Oedothorax gibbosus TaxID=931101 RepID=UPI0020248C61|nr:hypothetical protein [Cardinium endosymbiont of Oedothorax gibbosus]CAH2560093.1 hypothetical protein CAOEGIBSW744_0757 [Cardinium endosymbiont of Oedothorax gibbosus]